ncbi:hypothetical protein [Maribacter sp. 2308TA10-17]|uniref:hypothetical protein n=1 Tax=Maribacter sp. 2308TA10-17 TaxID=3386276 RepID=UPI0039BC5251
MKYIFLAIITFTFSSVLHSQKSDTKALYSKAIEAQIDFELQSNKYSSMYITFMDERFNDTKLTHHAVTLKNLSGKQLKSKSRKGIDIIEIYPAKLFDNKILIETLSIYKKRKKVTIYGKSTYFFEYDCEKEKYILVDKSQKMI